ncbi:hypothetical protein E1B28_011584 [Marasmius oreades]|uniref:Extracellular mutant protein 11 C-terminal domain-containing protein n=1 Tax=Marasmius oreades TaxID=181124 RepID=A0A9P7US90_9AGAR|nr:uncharacterized protein E1B28_011584 [Marasmius oreades]KAG7089959.1 hypothetical protein E1B28_011584 [Marasmius oreades]
MSARTPFIPNGSRPASRVTNKNSEQNVDPVSQQALSAHFVPETNSPLHHSDASSKAQSIHKGPSGSVPDPKATIQKPLNLNGFMKKIAALPNSSLDSTRQGHTARSRPSMDKQNIVHSLVRRDTTVVASSNLVTPVPRLAIQSMPPAFSLHPDSPGASFNTSAPLSSSNQPSSDAENFKLNLSMSKGAPPQRVPVEENYTLSGLIPRNRNKRTRPNEDEEQDPDLVYIGTAAAITTKRAQVPKRHKPQGHQLDRPPDIEYMRQSFSPQPFSSPVAHLGSEYNASPKDPTGFYHQQSGEGRGHSNDFLEDNNSKNHASTAGTNNTLDTLLGCQTNVYIDDHMARYQQLSSKWQECTIEEWVKGAEEIMAKYSKVLDYVKKHMESKLKLLASFDTQINEHKVILEGRAKVLDSAKQKLVSNGQDMIGDGPSGF